MRYKHARVCFLVQNRFWRLFRWWIQREIKFWTYLYFCMHILCKCVCRTIKVVDSYEQYWLIESSNSWVPLKFSAYHRMNTTFWVFSFSYFLFIATEIRCQEKSKGGLCYEVILGQPVTIAPLKQNKQQPSFNKPVSADEIARKLKEAEKRRLVRNNLNSWMPKKAFSVLNLQLIDERIHVFSIVGIGSKEIGRLDC